MKVKNVRIGPTKISVEVLHPSVEDRPAETDRVTCPSRPLDEFSQAFAALDAVFCEMFEVPAKWAEELTVTGISVTEREDGSHSAIIRATRIFNKAGGTPLATLKTPAFVYAGEDPHCKGGSSGMIEDALNEALRYYNGERQTTLLSGKEPTTRTPEDPNQPALPNT